MEGLQNVVNNLDALAELANPIKPGDFRDGQGILHCGKCGASMEYITKLENIKVSPAFYSELDEEHKQRVDAMRNLLAGRKHRIPCRCKEEERKAYEKVQKKQAIKDNMNYCFGRTPALFDCVFELDKSPDIWASKVARRFAGNFKTVTAQGNILVFCGDVGHGKTFYACAIANKLLQDGLRVKFTNISNLVGQAIQYHLSLQTIIDGVCENDLIILDDFGAEDASDKTNANTYQIINALYERKKPVVITTNLSKEKLNAPETIEQQRVYSRILERATVVDVVSPVGNRRMQGDRTDSPI